MVNPKSETKVIEDHGQPKHRPAPYSAWVHQFDCTPEQKRQLKATAHLLGVSMSEVLRRGIEEMAAKVEEGADFAGASGCAR